MQQVLFSTIAVCALVVSGCECAQLPALQSDARAEPPTVTVPANGGHVDFVRGYSQGFGEAREIGKPVLVFFSAAESVYCTQMLEETFTDQTVVDLSKRFVCIKVDIEDEPSVCQEFHVEGYPTVQFMSPRGVPLNRFTGKKEAGQLAMQMQAALEAVAYRTSQAREASLR